MPHTSPPELLALHAVRLTGMADDETVAARFALDRSVVSEQLLDFQAYGWITRVDFAGTGGWTLTDSGRAENERQLAAELLASGQLNMVRSGYRTFAPQNTILQRACTDWQLKPTTTDRLAVNDHFDPIWDRRVIETLDVLDAVLADLVADLSAALSRFAGYDDRFDRALARVQAGEHAWATGVEVDSCHAVWMELHEDLLATLGLVRGAELEPA